MALRSILTVLVVAVASAVPAAAQGTGSLAGRVVRAGGVVGIEGVEVRIRDTGLRAITDGRGEFAFDSVPAGVVTLETRHLAYRATEGVVEVHPAERVRIELRVDDQVFDLDPLVVTARTRPLLMRERMGGFYVRQARGMGTFLDRDDLARRPVSKVTDVLREVHGIRVVGSGITRQLVATRNPLVHVGSCSPVVYLDGFMVSARRIGGHAEAARLNREAREETVRILDALPTDQIAGIEIYPGAATVPGRFAGLDTHCGVIAVWTTVRDRGHVAAAAADSTGSDSGLLGNRILWFVVMQLGVALIMLMPVL